MGGLDEAIQSNPIGLDQEPLGLNDSMDRHRVRPDADSSELFETDGQDCFQVFGLGHFLDDLADTEEGGLLFVLALELLFFQRQFFDGPSLARNVLIDGDEMVRLRRIRRNRVPTIQGLQNCSNVIDWPVRATRP